MAPGRAPAELTVRQGPRIVAPGFSRRLRRIRCNGDATHPRDALQRQQIPNEDVALQVSRDCHECIVGAQDERSLREAGSDGDGGEIPRADVMHAVFERAIGWPRRRLAEGQSRVGPDEVADECGELFAPVFLEEVAAALDSHVRLALGAREAKKRLLAAGRHRITVAEGAEYRPTPLFEDSPGTPIRL